jgi:opacity protein-like surface antigen
MEFHMSLRRSCLTALALVAATAPAALAADPAGWYLSGQAGASWQDNANTYGAMNFRSHSDAGFGILGAAGRSFGNGFRVEGELGYRQIDLSKLSINGDGGAGAAAGTSSLNSVTTRNVLGGNHVVSFMGNGFYDFDLPNTRLKPYVGGGIGFARVEANDIRANGVPLMSDNDVVFAYQVGAGVSYPVTPQTDAFLDYRYFATQDPSFRVATGGTAQSELATQNVSVGMRYKF